MFSINNHESEATQILYNVGNVVVGGVGKKTVAFNRSGREA